MSCHSNLPNSLWGEELKNTTYIINRVSTKAATKTPYELWVGRKPSLKHFHVWGCWCEPYGANRLIQVIEFGWRPFRWRKISQGRRHFRWRKISEGRRHKDYLDKSEIGSTRNPEKSSHQILWKWQKFFLLKTKTNTYSVYEQKIKIDMGLLNSLGQNYNK